MAKASEQIAAFLDGKIQYSELTEAEKSAVRLPIYQSAVKLLAMSRDEIKRQGEALPECVRGLVRDELKRLYKHRRLEQHDISPHPK